MTKKTSAQAKPAATRKTATESAIKRMPLYLARIKEMRESGLDFVSGAVLAKELRFDPVVVRKDLAMTGVAGRPRLGFPIDGIIAAIESLLGWDNVNEAVLCGAGCLGKALLGYQGFKEHGLSIIAAFDVDKSLIGTTEHGIKIHDIGKLDAVVRKMKVQIGILTVPAKAAQDTANRMIAAGIRGIWNFTPVKLMIPEDIVVQRADLATGLAVLSHKLAHANAR